MEKFDKIPEKEWSTAKSAFMDWYEHLGRELPWRNTTDAYAVLVSETMLQQTRVEVVENRYAGFLLQFPNPKVLAEAPEDVLLKAWEGLGYYARARNLQKACRAIVELHGGSIPTQKEELLALPGVGPYTAAALQAIAFGQDALAIDANAERIFSRLLSLKENPKSASGRSHIEQAMLRLMPTGRGADFTQAMMDLGQLICVSRSPHCQECPLSSICLAYRQGNPEIYPQKVKQKEKRKEVHTVALLTDGTRLALERRPSRGLLASMYGLPMFDGKLTGDQMTEKVQLRGFKVEKVVPIPSWKHVFTHRVWLLDGYIIRVSDLLPEEDLTWADADAIATSLALPTAFQPAVREWLEWSQYDENALQSCP